MQPPYSYQTTKLVNMKCRENFLQSKQVGASGLVQMPFWTGHEQDLQMNAYIPARQETEVWQDL